MAAAQAVPADSLAARHWTTLTRSERRIAEMVGSGLSNTEIADRLFVSRYTVDSHLRRIYAKLGDSSRANLAHRAGRPRTS